ncbi:MAG: hypothetical protein JW889_01460 [Verrucomicrobia bacterium]|nr:hypothetical protein [Verrucomicrobiota bacterium]
MPGQPPPPPQGMAGPPEAEAPKKKYSFLTESRREEHVPQGPMFIPKREEKKKKRVGIRQIIIVVICMLAIAYAVISMAFKPLHGYLMGTVFEFAGKPEQAMKYYRKAAGSDGMWSEKASAAMTRIGKGVVKRHVETQFGGNWTAKTKITIQGRTTPIQLKSDLAYRAPGFIAERIRRTEPDAPAGQRLLNDQLYGVQFGTGFSEGPISIEAFSERIEQRAGLKMSELFDKANTDRVVQVLFDDLGMKLDEVIGEGPNKTYQFSIDVTDDVDRLRKLEAVMTPFFPWGEWRLRSRQRDIVRVELNFLEKEGLLEEVCYYDANGGIVAQQVFEDLNPGATVDDSLFR